MSNRIFLLLLAALLTVGACKSKKTGSSGEDEKVLPAGLFEGYVVIGPRVQLFTPCGSDRPLWLDVLNDEIRSAYQTNKGEGDYQPVYMVLDGDMHASKVEPYGQALTVKTVLESRAVAPGNCSLDHPGRFEARGNEPGWLLTISPEGDSISLVANYGESKSYFPYNPPVRWGNNWTYYTSSKKYGPLVVEVTHQECMDSMSGHHYTDEVMVKTTEGVLEGCGGTRIVTRKD